MISIYSACLVIGPPAERKVSWIDTTTKVPNEKVATVHEVPKLEKSQVKESLWTVALRENKYFNCRTRILTIIEI